MKARISWSIPKTVAQGLKRITPVLSLRHLRSDPLAVAGLAIIASVIFIAIFAPWLSPYSPAQIDLSNTFTPPNVKNLLGTDQLGRDILSRIIYGSQVSLAIGFVTVLLAASLGMCVGILSGYFGGNTDEIMMRITDIFFAFPSLVLAIAFALALGSGILNVIMAITIVSWPAYARLARAQALSVKEEQFVEASKALGASSRRIIIHHVLPSCLSPIIVQATLSIGHVILTAASLGFLGIGVPPGTAEWGVMTSIGRDYIMQQWWLSTFPGMAILVTALGFNILGDAIHDNLDPRLSRLRYKK